MRYKCFSDVWLKGLAILSDSQNSAISPSCPNWVFLFVIFPWLLPFPRVLWHDPQPRQHLWVESEVLPASLLDGVNVGLYCQSDSRHIHFGVRQFHPVMSGITFSVCSISAF